MKIYILQTVFIDYDAYDVTIEGVTSNPQFADAWVQSHLFSKADGWNWESVEVELDKVGPEVIKTIQEFLNPSLNPFCICGHRKLHHKKGPKLTQCLHNHKDTYKTQSTPEGPWEDVPPHICHEFVADLVE